MRGSTQVLFNSGIEQYLLLLNQKIQVSSYLLWLCRLVWDENQKTSFLVWQLIYTKSESVPVIGLIETWYSRYCSDHRETCCPVDRWEIPPTGQ